MVASGRPLPGRERGIEVVVAEHPAVRHVQEQVVRIVEPSGELVGARSRSTWPGAVLESGFREAGSRDDDEGGEQKGGEG